MSVATLLPGLLSIRPAFLPQHRAGSFDDPPQNGAIKVHGPWLFDRLAEARHPAGSTDDKDVVKAHNLCAQCCKIREAIRPFMQYGTYAGSKDDNQEYNFLLGQIPHHASFAALCTSAEQGCHLCSLLWASTQEDATDEEYRKQIQVPADKAFSILVDTNAQIYLVWSPQEYTTLLGCPRRAFEQPVEKSDPVKPIEADVFVNPAPSQLVRFTGSTEAICLAKSWLDTCCLHHGLCNKGDRKPLRLPTRLICLREQNEQLAANLILTKSQQTATLKYLTLSHCWGETNPLKLLQSNIEAFSTEIPIKELSATFQDALRITAKLGFQYLWIDSLCIVQDDPDDWVHEAVLMASVYGNAECNIAAVGSDGDSGCFQRRNPLALIPCALFGGQTDDIFYYPPVSYYYQNGDLLKKQFFTRGWIFQERLLSRRTIFFGAQEMAWECNTFEAAESAFPHGIRYAYDSRPAHYSPKYVHSEIARLQVALLSQQDNLLNYDVAQLWHRIITRYMSLKFTVDTDRLVGIAGVAEVFGSATEFKYLAGTWEQMLPLGLLWTHSGTGTRLSSWRAPSWSWASMATTNGLFHFPDSPSWVSEFNKWQQNQKDVPEYTWFGTVDKAASRLRNIESGPYGGLLNCSITITSRLQPVTWWKEKDIYFASPLQLRPASVQPNPVKNFPYYGEHLCDNPEICGGMMNHLSISSGDTLWHAFRPDVRSATTDRAWYFIPDAEIETTTTATDADDGTPPPLLLFFFLIARYKENADSEFYDHSVNIREMGLVLRKKTRTTTKMTVTILPSATEVQGSKEAKSEEEREEDEEEGEEGDDHTYERVGFFHRRHQLNHIRTVELSMSEMIFEMDGWSHAETKITIV